MLNKLIGNTVVTAVTQVTGNEPLIKLVAVRSKMEGQSIIPSPSRFHLRLFNTGNTEKLFISNYFCCRVLKLGS